MRSLRTNIGLKSPELLYTLDRGGRQLGFLVGMEIQGLATNGPTMKAVLQIMPLYYPRPGELRFSERPDFNLDADVPVWTILAHIAKMRREQGISLSRQAVDILRTLKSITGNQKYAFLALRGHDRALSECGMNWALRRPGYTKDKHTPLGFERQYDTQRR